MNAAPSRSQTLQPSSSKNQWGWGRPHWSQLERILSLSRLEGIYRHLKSRHEALSGLDFCEKALESLNIEIQVNPEELEQIPENGPCVVIANHPYGGVEGLALAASVRKVREDVRLLANSWLGRIEELQEILIPVELDSHASVNIKSMLQAVKWVRGGGTLIVFPSGMVSHFHPRMKCVTDPPWRESVAALIRRSGATTVPVHIPGRNGALFQLAGMLHASLRTAMLPKALLKQSGKPMTLRVGRPIGSEALARFSTDQEMITYLRQRTYLLGAEEPNGPSSPHKGAGSSLFRRYKPTQVQNVIGEIPRADLRREMDDLGSEGILVDQGPYRIYVAEGAKVPRLLQEIGRLREITFRAVGEGTGNEVDLDFYDGFYHHLILWNEEEEEVVGAYRLGLTDKITPKYGLRGLYTHSLFRFDESFVDSMGAGVELGRSFIMAKYQRQFWPLLLLWKGIGKFVSQRPQYRSLFGPVTISPSFSPVSQRLMVNYLWQKHRGSERQNLVSAKRPVRDEWLRADSEFPTMESMNELRDAVKDLERGELDVPVLVREYLKLGAKVMDFSYDPDFANCLDAMIVVDLEKMPAAVQARFLGKSRKRGEPRQPANEASSLSGSPRVSG